MSQWLSSCYPLNYGNPHKPDHLERSFGWQQSKRPQSCERLHQSNAKNTQETDAMFDESLNEKRQKCNQWQLFSPLFTLLTSTSKPSGRLLKRKKEMETVHERQELFSTKTLSLSVALTYVSAVKAALTKSQTIGCHSAHRLSVWEGQEGREKELAKVSQLLWFHTWWGGCAGQVFREKWQWRTVAVFCSLLCLVAIYGYFMHNILTYISWYFPTKKHRIKPPVRDRVLHKVKLGLFKQIKEMFFYGNLFHKAS